MTDVSVSINADLQKKIAKIAKKNGQSFNELVARALPGRPASFATSMP